MTWRYVVTNTGNAPIADVTVTDDQAGVDPAFQSGDTDGDGLLDPSETWTYEATGTATEGQYENFGTVTGTDPLGTGLTDTDPSHYFGASPAIDIEKSTNGADADLPPGPFIPVTDRKRRPDPHHLDLPGHQYRQRQAHRPRGHRRPRRRRGLLPGRQPRPGALDDLHRHRRRRARPIRQPRHGDRRPTRSGPRSPTPTPPTTRGVLPGIDVEKSTNGADADNVPGPLVAVGDPVVWSYVVTNTSNDPLTNVAVTDDQGVPVTCPSATLAPDASMTCTAPAGTAEPGQYENLATATGTGTGGRTVRDSDPSHYFGEDPSIDIEKSTNGQDADDRARAPDPRRRPGHLDL